MMMMWTSSMKLIVSAHAEIYHSQFSSWACNR